MFGISNPMHFVVEQMRLLNDTQRLSNWLERAPASCGNAETLKAAGTCIDDVCKLRGKVRNPNVDVYGLGFTMASNLDNPATREMARALNAGLADRFKDDFCMDPPSDGLKQRIPFTLTVRIPETAQARTILVGVGAFLGILALRAVQFSTGGFTLFTVPERHDYYKDGI